MRQRLFSGDRTWALVLPPERLQRRPVADRPSMSERIGEAVLMMDSPLCFVIRGGFYRGRPSLGSTIDEAARLINENLNARGGQADVGRARLCRPAWYRLVTKNGAPSRWSPATPPRFQSSTAPSAFEYQPTASEASGTINITEGNGRPASRFVAVTQATLPAQPHSPRHKPHCSSPLVHPVHLSPLKRPSASCSWDAEV